VIYIKHYNGHCNAVFLLSRGLSQSKLDFSTAIQHSNIVVWYGHYVTASLAFQCQILALETTLETGIHKAFN